MDDHCRLIKVAVKSLLTNPLQIPGVPALGTEAGQILVWNGSQWSPTRNIHPFEMKSASFTAARLGRYYITGSITATLPSTNLADGDWVEFIVAASGVTIARAGMTIMGLAEDLTVDVVPSSFKLVYYGPAADWRIAP
ncbi:MAG: hypothetical protein ACP5QB_10115 [Thiomonas sp.]